MTTGRSGRGEESWRGASVLEIPFYVYQIAETALDTQKVMLKPYTGPDMNQKPELWTHGLDADIPIASIDDTVCTIEFNNRDLKGAIAVGQVFDLKFTANEQLTSKLQANMGSVLASH